MEGPSIRVQFSEGQEPEETALLLEVIAGEIRRGHTSGDEAGATWTMIPAGCGDSTPRRPEPVTTTGRIP